MTKRLTLLTNTVTRLTQLRNTVTTRGKEKKKKNSQLSLQLEVVVQKHKKQTKGMWYIKSKMSYASDRRLEID